MEIKNELINIVSDYVDIPADQINTSDNMKMTAGIDSFVLFSMVSDIENHFGIKIPNQKLATFTTLDDIIEFIKNQLNG